MTDRWQQIERIFEEMLLLAEPLRHARLLELTANDPGLRREVESLLAQQPAESGFLESPVAMAQDLRRTLLGDFLLGKQFGSYRVDSLIGEGGMGLVFRATDIRSSHPVALKILPPEAARHAERNKQFEREKKALEKLQHPAIVRLLDFGADGGFAYLVMEYVDGQTLRDILAGRAPESLGTQSLIDQFVSALAAVHGAGLVHGDLKPDNLMITGSGQLKLVDFGLATQVSPVSMSATVAELGLAGTIGYSAPERIRGDSASPASDVFAAGAVLFEILTRRPLFEGKTPWAVAERILEGRPDLSAAPTSWRRVLRACLTANPAARIQDGVALASSVRGTPGSLAAWRRFRAPAAALGTVLAAAACGYWLRSSPQLPASLVLGDHVSPRIAVSPDGKWVAYSQRDPGNQTQSHIVLRSTAGGGATQLTTGPYRDSLPSFAGNGRRLLFESNRSPEGIYAVTIGTAAAPKLAIAGGHAPRASPDGKWLVYFLSRLGSGDSHATAPGVALASLAEGYPRKWLNTEYIPLGPGVWRQDSSSFTLRAASAASNAPEERTFSATFGIRSNAGIRSQDGFRELCGWAGPGTLLGLSGLTGISAVPADPHSVPSVPLLLHDTPQLESCVVQENNVFGVQSSRQTAFLAAAVASNSELSPNGFQLDPRFVGATSPSMSLDGRWAAFNAEARNGQPAHECLFDFHSGRDFIINTLQSSIGTPKLSASGKVVLVLEADGGTRYGIRYVDSLAPVGVELPVEAIAWDIAEEGQVILTASSTSPRSIRANRPSTAAVWTVVSSPKHNLYLARISPDEKWLVFTAEDIEDHKPVIYAAPYHVGRGSSLSEWVRLGSGDYPAWSASGSAVYYLDESLPVAELKGMALDSRTKQPLGEPVTVHRFNGEWRPSGLLPGTFRIAASRERVWVTVGRYEMTLLRAK